MWLWWQVSLVLRLISKCGTLLPVSFISALHTPKTLQNLLSFVWKAKSEGWWIIFCRAQRMDEPQQSQWLNTVHLSKLEFQNPMPAAVCPQHFTTNDYMCGPSISQRYLPSCWDRFVVALKSNTLFWLKSGLTGSPTLSSARGSSPFLTHLPPAQVQEVAVCNLASMQPNTSLITTGEVLEKRLIMVTSFQLMGWQCPSAAPNTALLLGALSPTHRSSNRWTQLPDHYRLQCQIFLS